MTDLEQRLTDLGRHLAYPPTPDMVALLRSRLSAAQPRPRPLSFRFAVAAAVLIAAIGALLAIPTTRDAIADFLGIKGIIIQRAPTMASPTPTGSPSELGDRLRLGRLVTLDAAQAALPYSIVLSQSLGTPDAVYVMEPADRQAVALVYLPRPDLPEASQTGVGALIVEFPGQVEAGAFGKLLGPDTRLETVQVNGRPGYWISGAPHAFYFVDRQGNYQQETLRLAGNTLIWDTGPLTIRIESALTKTQALAVAASVR